MYPDIHRRRRPIVGPLQRVETRKVLQKSAPAPQVVQPLTAPITIFTIEIAQKNHCADCPAAGARAFLRHASFKRVSSKPTPIWGAKLLNLSQFSIQVAPIVIVANCVKTGKASEGALFTETRIPVGTHLVSNVSLGKPPISRIAH